MTSLDSRFAVLADVPAFDPVGNPVVVLAIAAAVAIGAALFAYSRIVRRRSAARLDASAGRRPDA